MASSASLASSLSAVEWEYDVFLSFRGPDTRKGIIFELYDELWRRGIKTFKDDRDLEVGDVILPALMSAIEKSRFAIVVFSQTYASSTCCLEELTKICECMKDQNRIFPFFYEVEPSDVRYQKNSFGKPFSKYETRYGSEKVKQWRDALHKVADFYGWNTNNQKPYKELIDDIVEFLCYKGEFDAIEPTGYFEAFKATKQAMNQVMKELQDDEVTAVGVYGMPGVGKTTMVKHVGAHARKIGIFDFVIMGVASQSSDLRKIQGTLGDLLGVKFDQETEIGRADRLRKVIMRKNKILIILDDIWERMDLFDIGIPSYKELQKRNSKVLLTTRIEDVCHAMGCQRKIKLSTLSEEDSWTLFMRTAGVAFESTNFEDVAKRVGRECCGLPIALVTVARALGDKELEEWKRAARRLKKSQSATPGHNEEASRCIRLSYDYLKNKEYKSYFLLCCLFPEDYDIPIEVLFRYTIGKGLFRDADTLQEARENADSLARYLKHSCLLLDGRNNEFVRMHDVVRDTAIKIAESEDGFFVRAGFHLEDWPHQLHEGYSTVSLMGNFIGKLPEKLVCPKLQILLLNRIFFLIKIPETFFQGPNELMVLDLSSTSISLPESFSLLTNLQVLYLDGPNRIESIDTSILGKLKKIEILSMRYCILEELSREMGNLINLRMLDITGGVIHTIPSKVISKWHNIEELYMQGFLNWGNKVEGEGEETNAGFDEVTSLSKLRILKVSMSDAECIPKFVEFYPNWVEFDICIGTYNKREAFDQYGHNSIHMELDTISRLPDWFFNTVMNVDRLQWEGCQRLIDIFMESEHGRLQGLKHLYITGTHSNNLMNTITWVPKKSVFKNLEKLHLTRVDCQELYVGILPPGSLSNLKVLEVQSCYNWGNVLLPSTLSLPNLEEVKCCSMQGIKYVFGYEALFEPKQSKLRKIVLSDLHRVRSICEGAAPLAMFETLQSLSIIRCNLLGSLFTYDIAQCLSELKYFHLENCPFLERIVEASSKKIILPKLKELKLLLLDMCYESATFDIECPSLEDWEMWECPNFLVYLSDFHSGKQVQLNSCH